MAGSPDSSNLMYVTKAYEEEIKNKAKRIYANDEVALSLENVNKQLTDIISEIEEKLNFVNDKIVGEYGVDEYVQGVHTQIDRVDINQEDLVPEDIKNTRSHPSTMAVKGTRADTKYTLYDFINKSVEFNNNTPNLALSGTKTLDPNENMMTFSFNTSSQEYMKIIEFSFTYKQYPDLIMIDADKNISRETTVTITRIISGRFFLIRHDPVNHPDQFIIKAIIKNSDNTGNVIDRKIIDVQSFKESGDFSYIFDNGPQFDLYFTFSGNEPNGLKIHFGKIVPYRYIARKTFINTNDGTLDSNFKKIDTAIGATTSIGSHNIEDIFHSSNLSCSFVVDKTRNEISIFNDGNRFDNRVLASEDNIKHMSGSTIDKFWVKDVGYFTFIRLKDNDYNTCFVGINNVNNLIDLGRSIDDAIELSTGEILVKIGNNYYFYNTTDNTINTQQIYSLTNPDLSFNQKSMILEYQNKNLILVYTKKDGVFYRIKELDKATNLYATNLNVSPEHEITTFPKERIELINPTDCDIFGFSDTTGIYIGANYIGESSSVPFILHCNNLVISGISYLFTENNILSVYNKNNKSTSALNLKISKMINTKLFNFLILENNELFIFDEKRIVKAISFEYVENKGWSDKNSVLYMKPDANQDEYFLIDNAYLQKVIDVVDTPNGVIIVDKDGIYSLDESKNITCRLFFENNSELVKYLPSFDKYGRSGVAISIDDKTSPIHKYSIFKNDYLLKEYSGNKIRYEYLDLFTSNYQLYDENVETYNEELPIVDFHSILYISFVDHLSVLYNSTGDTNISEDESLTYSLLFNPDYNTQKYCISPNKYGFIKYDNILSLNTSESRISDINLIKKFKIIHKADSDFTYQDALDNIHEMIKKEYEKFKSDPVYINSRKHYISDITNYKPFEHSCIEHYVLSSSKVSDPRVIYRFVDTKYGRYGYGYDDNNHRFCLVWLSNSILESNIRKLDYTIDDDKIKILPLTNFYGSIVSDLRDFKIIALDDEHGTTFITDGNHVYKTYARDENGNYTIPFTDVTKVIQCQASDENLTNIIKTYDNEILAWISRPGSQDIYRYDIVSETFSKVDELTNIFTNEVDNINSISIMNVIKINGTYHIIGFEDIANGNLYSFKYIQRGKNHLTIDLNGSLVPLNGTIESSSSDSTIEFFEFTNDILAVIHNNKQPYICKYDKTLDKFVPCIYDLKDINGESSMGYLKLYEIKNTETESFDIYGVYSCFNESGGDEPIYPNIFKINTTYDYIETIIPLIINHENVIESFYDKYTKQLVFLHGTNNSSDRLGRICYYPENDSINILDEDSTIFENNISQRSVTILISEPKKIISRVNDVDTISHEIYSLVGTPDPENSTTKLYLSTIENNKQPKEMYRIGYESKLSDTIIMPRITEDNYPEIQNDDTIKTYYKLDPSRTIFNMYPTSAISYPLNAGTKDNLVKIFMRTVKNNGKKIQIDKSVIKEPIRGFTYYKLDLNGTYVVQNNLKKFDELSNYFIDDATYTLITKNDYDKYGGFDSSLVNIDNKDSRLLITSIDPKFIECTIDDFELNPDPADNQIHKYKFKEDINYYEFEEKQYQFNFNSLNNFRFLDDKFMIKVSNNPIFNEHELAYEYEDPSLFIQQPNRNKIIEHLLPDIYDKIIKTKFCKLGIVTRTYADDRKIISIERLSDDLKFIKDEYLYFDITQGDKPEIEINETSKYIFITVVKNNNPHIHNTYIIDGETLECSETNTNSDNDYHYITEFENGNVYGVLLDTSSGLKVAKHGVNGTKAFSTSTDDGVLTIDVSTARVVKALKHVRQDGRIELLIFCFGNKYQVYRLYDDILTSYDDDALQHLIFDERFTIIKNKFIDYKRNIIYDFDTKEISFNVKPLTTYYGNLDFSKLEVKIVSDELYENINRNCLIFKLQGDEYGNQIVSTIYDFIENKFDPFSLFDENNNLVNENETDPLSKSTDMIMMSKQMPIVSKDGDLYYTFAKGRSDNLIPQYDSRYDVYNQNGSLKHKNCNFDRIYNTSYGIFGIYGLEICLNGIYSNDNDFIHIMTLTNKWTIMSESKPIIQEIDGEVYLCYRNIYRFNNETYTFVPILTFDDNIDIRSGVSGNKFDEYDLNDKFFTKLFVTEFNDMYYFTLEATDITVNVYKYNKTTKVMELYWELSGFVRNIRETSLGVLVTTGDNRIYNISRKESLPMINTDNHTLVEIMDIIEFNSKYKYLYVLVRCDDNKTYGYRYRPELREWEANQEDGATDVNYNKIIHKVYTKDDKHYDVGIYCIYDYEKNKFILPSTEPIKLYYKRYSNVQGNYGNNFINIDFLSSTIEDVDLFLIKSDDENIRVGVKEITTDMNSELCILEFRLVVSENDTVQLEPHIVKRIQFNSSFNIKSIIYHNGIFILQSDNSTRTLGFNIKEIKDENIDSNTRHVGYVYSVIGENTKKWNNEEEDISNTLKDKYLMKVVGLYNDNDEFDELFIDNNNEYETDVDLFHSERMSLVEFYKRFYMSNWEKKKHNHIFKRKDEIMNDLYMSSLNPLKNDNTIFNNEQFEIELNIFGSPIETSEENKFDSVRIFNSWYLKKLNRHNPYLPYYPFSDK